MSQNISIQLSPSTIQLLPGENIDVSLTVTNNSGHITRFLLALPDLEADWYSFSKSDILLYPEEPGNSETLLLRLTIPSHATPGSYAPTINVIDNDTQQLTATFPFILVVNTKLRVPPELTITPDTETSKERVAQYQVKVRQVSDITSDNLILFATPLITVRPRKGTPRAGISLSIRPRTIDLRPYEEVVCALEVRTLRRNWFGIDRRYEFNVGIQGTNIEKTGNFVQTCRWPWVRGIASRPLAWVGVLLIPIVLAALLVFLLIPHPQTSDAANLVNQTFSTNCFTPPAYTSSSYVQMQGGSSYIILTTPNGAPQTIAYRTESAQLPGLFSSLTSVSPNGNTIAYVTAGDESLDNASIYIVDVNQHQTRLIATLDPGTSLWPTRPIWSSDGSELAYVVVNKGKLQLLYVTLTSTTLTGNVLADNTTVSSLTPSLFYTSNPTARPLCWADDNKSILVSNSNGNGGTQVPIDVRARPRSFTSTSTALNTTSTNTAGLLQPAPVDATSACYLKTLSQLDPQWRDNSVGSKNQKISSVGCPVTTLAMVLNYFNPTNPSTPAQIGTCLGDSDGSINWTQVATLSCSGGLQGGNVTPFSWDGLNNSLLQGLPVIVGLAGGQTGIHYVVVVGGANGVASTYRVNDPWDGTNYKTLSDFIAEGYYLKNMVIYSKSSLPACSSRSVIPGQPASQLAVQNFYDGQLLNQPGFRVSFANNRPITATLYNIEGSVTSAVSNSSTAVTATTQTSFSSRATTTQQQLKSQDVQSGSPVNSEGLYTLVLDTTSDSGQPLREIWHFLLDTTAPSVNPQFTPKLIPINNVQTSSGPVSISFSAADNLSGVSEVHYSLDNSPDQTYNLDGSSSPISITTYTDHSLSFYATDLAGNTSARQNFPFTVKTPQQLANNITSTTVIAIINNKTPTPGGNGANGSGNGGANGGNGAAATTTVAKPPATTPPPAVVTVANGQLTVPSPLVNFDANTSTGTFSIVNSGASAVTWSIQPPSAPLASLLSLPQQTGTVPPNGTVSIPVNLASFNTTTAPITGIFQLVYNNGAARVPINVTVANQPTPSVAFVSPTANAVISTGVTVQLKVTPTGAAKPDHISLSAKYVATVGGQPASQALTATATLANNWTVFWPAPASIPPQSGIEIDGNLCWTADQSSCTAISALTGLTVPQPSATFTLSSQPILSPNVTVTAQVSGFINHVTYNYSYSLNGAPVATPVTLPTKGMGNSSSITWNTTNIPPQTGTITLNALLCWGTDDNPANCKTVAGLATGLTVNPPTITGNALASNVSTNLPVQTALSGSVTNLNTTSAAVFITYTYTVPGGALTTSTPVQATLNTTNGTWAATVDTSKVTPQNISFVPQICWDGKFGGSYCYPAATAITGTVADFAVSLKTTNSNLDTPLSVVATASPVGRASQVSLLANFNDLAGISHTVSIVTTTVDTSGNANFASIDTTNLGIPPDVAVTFYTQVCGSTTPAYCSTPSGNISNLRADDTTLTPSAAPASLPSNFTVNATDNTRGATKLTFQASYLTNPSLSSSLITTTIYTSTSSIANGQTLSFVWNTLSVPPQTTINTSYIACWGSFTNNCKTYSFYSTPLTILPPQVTKVSINNSGTYNTANILPIPIDTSNLSIVDLPVQATITGTEATGIQWSLQITDGNFAPLLQQSLVLVTATATTQYSATIPINLATLASTGQQLRNMHVQLIGSPIWNNAIVYATTNSSLDLNTELVTINLNMSTANSTGAGLLPVSLSPTSTVSPVMITDTTYFYYTFSDPNLVKQMNFEVGVAGSSNTALNFTQAQVQLNNYANWLVTWDHINDSPKVSADSKMNLVWTVCSAANDAGSCLPYTLPGAVLQLSNLTLGNVEFASNTLASTLASGRNYSSAFTVTVHTTIPITATNQMRFFAYDPIGGKGAELGSYILLANSDLANGNYVYQLYWPDSNSIYTLGTVPPSALAQILTGNNNGGLISISVQYCYGIVPNYNTGLNNAFCSDWQGKKAANITSGWQATSTGKQPIITIWKPTDTDSTATNPFTVPFSSTTTLTITVITVTVASTNVPNLYYSDQTGANSGSIPALSGSSPTYTTTWTVPSSLALSSTILLKSTTNSDLSVIVGAVGASNGRFVVGAVNTPIGNVMPPLASYTSPPPPTATPPPTAPPDSGSSTTAAPPGAAPATPPPPPPTATPVSLPPSMPVKP